MAQTVIVKSKAGHVLEMSKLSFDRVWGPNGRQGGYELATEADKDEDGVYQLTPRELGLPEGKDTIDDLSDDERTELFRSVDASMAVPASGDAVELTEKLGGNADSNAGQAQAADTPSSNATGAGTSSGAPRNPAPQTPATTTPAS